MTNFAKELNRGERKFLAHEDSDEQRPHVYKKKWKRIVKVLFFFTINFLFYTISFI